MKGLLPNQVITVLDEETIVWGISCYKKTGELVDVAELEKMWESRRTKKSISQKLRRICSPHTEALFMGIGLGFAIGIAVMVIITKCQSL